MFVKFTIATKWRTSGASCGGAFGLQSPYYEHINNLWDTSWGYTRLCLVITFKGSPAGTYVVIIMFNACIKHVTLKGGSEGSYMAINVLNWCSTCSSA